MCNVTALDIFCCVPTVVLTGNSGTWTGGVGGTDVGTGSGSSLVFFMLLLFLPE